VRRKGLTSLFLILIVAIGGLAATFVTGSSPELGLDLQGGVSVVLAPTKKVEGERLNEALDIIRTRVDALGVAEPDIARQGDAIVVQLPGVKNRDRALDLVGQTAELRFRPVLQQASVAEAEAQRQGSTTTTAADSTATTAASATTAPADTTATTAGGGEGAYGLAPGENAGVLLPGTAERASSPAVIRQGSTGTTAPADTSATTAPAGDTTATTAPAQATGAIPSPTPRQSDSADEVVVLDDKEGNRYQLGPALATGEIVASASPQLQNGQWSVSLEMKGGANGIDKFNEIAGKCYGQDQDCPTGSLAIVLDSVVQSAPRIQEPSFSKDQIQISGSFTESEAKDLALVLRYGSLPVELERQTVQTVSASLGSDSLRAGVVAGIVGLVLVALYMLAYYRALGVVVILGLAVWGSLLYSIISWLGATQGLALTLAGVTGIIVSIGVTVDSYVVFFERLKDEVKSGRTLRTSSERAFTRAFRTILAADVSSFMGAAILWWLTVGSVRGFAFFLGLSTVLDVIVAYCFTRPVVTLLSQNRVFTEMPVLGVARGLATDKPGTRGAERAPAAAGGAAVTGAGR
jgi:preprotein translocase subunit SecD